MCPITFWKGIDTVLLCNSCNAEYPEGTGRCPVCDGPLSESPSDPESAFADKLPSAWPCYEDGKSVKPAVLINVDTGINGEITVGLLEACDIPVVKSYPLAGRAMNVLFGFSGAGMDLLVPETMLEDAKAVLEANPAAEFSDEEMEAAFDQFDQPSDDQ